MDKFIEAIDDKLIMNQFDNIKEIRINSVQLNALHDVVEQMTKDKVSEDCHNHKSTLTVTGRFVKISDVVDTKCFKHATDIRVFASDTLFIDEDIDKSGESADISFIAPKWKVIGERKIKLNGEDAKHWSDSADNGNQDKNNDQNKNGENGKVGKTGGSAGHFFGIGKEFFDSDSLTIKANGGDGGHGQDGGNGADGIDADDLIKGDYGKNPTERWKEWGYEFKWLDQSDPFSDNYEVNIRSKHTPGNGGNGGKGGYGGLAGHVNIIEFGHSSSIHVKNSNGNLFQTTKLLRIQHNVI